MKPETSTQEFASPYALVVFFSDEHRAALLKAIAQAGIVPLLCKSPEEAAEAMKNETVQRGGLRGSSSKGGSQRDLEAGPQPDETHSSGYHLAHGRVGRVSQCLTARRV